MAPEPRRGTCPVCRRQIRLTRAGRIWNHNRSRCSQDPPHPCPGKGEVPVERATLIAKAEELMNKADQLLSEADARLEELTRKIEERRRET